MPERQQQEGVTSLTARDTKMERQRKRRQQKRNAHLALVKGRGEQLEAAGAAERSLVDVHLDMQVHLDALLDGISQAESDCLDSAELYAPPGDHHDFGPMQQHLDAAKTLAEEMEAQLTDALAKGAATADSLDGLRRAFRNEPPVSQQSVAAAADARVTELRID